LNKFTRSKRKEKLKNSCRELRAKMRIRSIDSINKRLLKGVRMRQCYLLIEMIGCLLLAVKWENKKKW
jgi:hypothetical protein